MAAKPSYFWIALALALYLIFSLTFLQRPGLQYDEVNFVNAALGNENGLFVAWSAKIFGRKLPLMIMEYIGALKSGLYVPIFKIFGTSAITARLPVVGIGLITLLFSYVLFRRMFDRGIAIVGLLLFATDPTFIFANKLDWGPVSLMLVLELSSLYFMWRWMTEGKRCFLALAGFLFGLGLYNKIIFIWFLIAFSVALLLYYRENFKKLLQWRQLRCFLPAFLLGCLPLLAFNIDVPMGTFRGRPVVTSPGIDTFLYRYLLVRGTLDGSGVYYLVNYGDVGNPSDILKTPLAGQGDRIIRALAGLSWVRRSPLPLALAGSLALILVLWGLGRLRGKKEILFMGTHLLVIALLICLNEKATGAQHVIAFYPFVFIVIAYSICELGRWIAKSQTAAGVFMCVCLLPLISAQTVLDARYLESFQAKGGCGFWSDAIYDLASFVRENPGKNYLLMEWGFSNQLVLLSNGRIQYEDFACEQNNLETCMESVLTRMNTYFVFHVPPFETQPLLETFKKILAKRNLQGRILRTFYQRDSQPIYIVYEIVHPMLDAYAKRGGFYYMREGEDFDAKSGGSLDMKDGASNKKALGNFWGRRVEDFVSYKFTLPRDVADAYVYLRYAFEDHSPHEYYLLLDGNFIDTFTMPSTQGFGYTADQWKTFGIRLGNLGRGIHELKFKPGGQNQLLNLDYWYLCEGPFKPEDAPPAMK